MLVLSRPFVWLDAEIDSSDFRDARVLELGYFAIMPDGKTASWEKLFDTGRPIDPAVTAIHGISDADVVGCQPFSYYGETLHRGLIDCDIGGFNVDSDIGWIKADLLRSNGIVWDTTDVKKVDGFALWKKLRRMRLRDAVAEWCGREPTKEHRALGDTLDARDVVHAMIEKGMFPFTPTPEALHNFAWPPDPNKLDSQGKFRWREDGVVILTFGKHSGVPLMHVDPGFLKWMLGKDFADDAKEIAKQALRGIYPTRTTPAG